ncbi:MAG: hypothetical protein Q7U96_03310 [Chloroflexota bacterium]|nr:hypothetical protein [Chloroflexota bacterium]
MAVVQNTRPNPVADNADTLRIAGLVIVVSSLVASLLILFVLPGSCSFVSGLLLLFSIGLLLVGLVMLIVRKVMLHRAHRSL